MYARKANPGKPRRWQMLGIRKGNDDQTGSSLSASSDDVHLNIEFYSRARVLCGDDGGNM